MCFHDDWFLLFQSLCPSFPPRIAAGTSPEQVLQRETLSSQRLLCQHQERFSFHQPKVRISSRFSSEFQRKIHGGFIKPQSNQVLKYWKDLPVSTLNQRHQTQGFLVGQHSLTLTPKRKHPPLSSGYFTYSEFFIRRRTCFLFSGRGGLF